MSDAEEDEEGSGKRLTPAEFAQAKNDYELGLMGVGELADKFGVARQTMSRRFKTAGVIKGSRAHELVKVAAAVVEKFADKRAAWIEETKLNGIQALKQAQLLARKIVVDEMKQTNGRLSNVDADLKAAMRYNKILVDNIAAQLDILDANSMIDEDDLPHLIVEDLTDEDVLAHHKRTGAMPEDMTVEEMLQEEIELELDD